MIAKKEDISQYILEATDRYIINQNAKIIVKDHGYSPPPGPR